MMTVPGPSMDAAGGMGGCASVRKQTSGPCHCEEPVRSWQVGSQDTNFVGGERGRGKYKIHSHCQLSRP